MPQMLMAHTENPAAAIFKKIGMKKPGVLPGFELMANRILVGIYVRPNITASGIHLADRTIDEDRYQGKAALVLMMGPSAYVTDENFSFGDQKLEVGDWIAIFVSDGRAINIAGQSCRILRDQDVTMKIPSPDIIY